MAKGSGRVEAVPILIPSSTHWLTHTLLASFAESLR